MAGEEFEKLLKKTVAPAKVRDSLVNNPYLSDVTFTLGKQNEELPAHKFFLMTASPILYDVFARKESSDNIRIGEISKETMIEVCRYAYTEQVKLTTVNMIPLLQAASGLQMKFLSEKVINFICKEGMNEKTVFQILEANQKDKHMIINMKSFAYIEKNHQKCLKSNEFLALPADTLRLMLQTCKLPQTAAKEAIALWSSQEENKDEDLDELIALVSLNDNTPEESNGAVSNDTDSVTSEQSRATIDGPRSRHQEFVGKFRNKFGGSNQSLDHQMGQSKNKKFNASNHSNVRAENAQLHKQMIERQNQQRLFSTGPVKNAFFIGPISRRSQKYSNLDLTVASTPIGIRALQFVYDLRKTDQVFEVRISDVTTRKKDIFYDQVQTTNQREPFYSYTLPRMCELPANSHIWISIEFEQSVSRPSFDQFNITAGSDRIAIRGKVNPAHAQIISAIVFSDQ